MMVLCDASERRYSAIRHGGERDGGDMMSRPADDRDFLRLAPTKAVQKMYQRVLSGWASDLLRPRNVPTVRPAIAPAAADPLADYRDRDWRRLYRGNLLDD